MIWVFFLTTVTLGPFVLVVLNSKTVLNCKTFFCNSVECKMHNTDIIVIKLMIRFLLFFICVGQIEKEPKHKLHYSHQRRTYGQAWHTIRALKEDWQKLQQGQKAAM